MSQSSTQAFAFRPLTHEFLPSAVRLSTQAGWNQTPEDWERALRLPPHCVKVWTDESEVRASYSVIGAGPRVGWIGMILVDTAYRGKGLGKIAFAGAMEDARAAGFSVIGLDATDLGEPIYRKFGFEVCRPIARWSGVLRATGQTGNNYTVSQGYTEGISALDRDCTGEDRSTVLADLATGSGTLLRLEERGHTVAYAGIRPGRNASQLGPVVALTDQHLAPLLNEAARVLNGQKVCSDVLNESSGVFAAHGLEPLRHLKRMTLPKEIDCLCGPGVRCAAGFELG